MTKTSLLNVVVSLLFPIDCAICGNESSWLCDNCLKPYQKIRLSNCFICGRSASWRSETGICRSCSQNTAIDGVISIFPYGQLEIRRLIKTAKYHGGRDALEFLAETFRQKIFRLLPEEIGLVTFTPSTKIKEKERGYNPARVFAKALASGEAVAMEMFEKIKDTASQTKLTKKKRWKNVRGAYRLKTKNLPEILVIVDDVITTGATLGVLAKLAKKRGAKVVWAVTICHG